MDCYTFLDNLLPHDLRFFILEGSGRQYISMNRKTQKHANYDEDREWTIQGDGEKDFYIPKDYGGKMPLQFARKHAKWQHIGREVHLPTCNDTSEQGRKGRDQTLC